ncbi:MAG: hypothetical protein KDE54_10450 [Caldilineaceae bacterium]|nr:hypothetical protein [Caldilineaceae bacterium]
MYKSCVLCIRLGLWALIGLLVGMMPGAAHAQNGPLSGPAGLVNPSFECTNGYYAATNSDGVEVFVPNGWQMAEIMGAPVVASARIFFAGSCEGSAHVERIDGIDSIVVRAKDIETPPDPGKPFDVAFYQQTDVMTGTAYSLSSWMLSLCGGSAVPSDCPEEQYIAKMAGIDPTGGTDPLADTVVWAENRDNFVDQNDARVGWSNVRLGVVAQGAKVTVFARVNSPSQHHGNHAFIDVLSLVKAPTAQLTISGTQVLSGTTLLPNTFQVRGSSAKLQWAGELGSDIEAIEGGSHQLLFDIQVRQQGTNSWSDLLVDVVGAGCHLYEAPGVNVNYEFRIRPRAEQLSAGVFPNQRYPGVWSEPVTIQFREAPSGVGLPLGDNLFFLPITNRPGAQGC